MCRLAHNHSKGQAVLEFLLVLMILVPLLFGGIELARGVGIRHALDSGVGVATRAMQGVILTSHELTKTLLERATTSTGLQVVVHIINKVYETGRKVTDDFKETMRIVFDHHLGQWNYRVVPLSSGTG